MFWGLSDYILIDEDIYFRYNVLLELSRSSRNWGMYLLVYVDKEYEMLIDNIDNAIEETDDEEKEGEYQGGDEELIVNLTSTLLQ